MKLTFPLLAVTLLAIVAKMYYQLLPQAITNALLYLPYVLILLTTTMALHFNQIKILCFVFIMSCQYFFLSNNVFENEQKFTLFATIAPMLLLLTVVLKQQSLFTVKALPFYLLHTLALVGSLWLMNHHSLWVENYLLKTWVATEYFNWTPIPQISTVVMGLVFLSIIVITMLKKQNIAMTALGMLLIMIIGLQFTLSDHELVILICASYLLCLINLMQESWNMAYVDELTQIPHRRALREKLQSLIGIYSIAMIDIDFFKKFNDKYGHDQGDEALKMVAHKLKSFPTHGTAYRYGGEEFTLVFPNRSLEQVKEQLEALRENIAQNPFKLMHTGKQNVKQKAKTVKITVSIGVADSIGISSSQQTLNKADKALYRAKKKGRNCLAF